jgi:geranylgeranyl diphosphate synthase type I
MAKSCSWSEIMIDDELERRAGLVSTAIQELLPIIRPEGLYQASRHLADAGGKRLRPSMLLIAAEAAGGDPAALVPAAVSIELIHNFTLIHDDIMDNAAIRRGRPSVHAIWGNSGAILAGDTLYSKAFQILGMTKADPKLLLRSMDILSKTCTAICEGQWLDLDFEQRSSVSEEEYMEMIEKKTGVLYGASASIGTVLAGAPDDVALGLDEYGKLTGMGFQIHDDVLDLTASEKVLGKRQGGDIAEGKKTLIMIQAMQKGIQLEAFGKQDASPQDIKVALEMLKESGSIDYAIKRAEHLVDRGKKALDVLPDSSAKTLLLNLADYMIRRGY